MFYVFVHIFRYLVIDTIQNKPILDYDWSIYQEGNQMSPSSIKLPIMVYNKQVIWRR